MAATGLTVYRRSFQASRATSGVTQAVLQGGGSCHELQQCGGVVVEPPTQPQRQCPSRKSTCIAGESNVPLTSGVGSGLAFSGAAPSTVAKANCTRARQPASTTKWSGCRQPVLHACNGDMDTKAHMHWGMQPVVHPSCYCVLQSLSKLDHAFWGINIQPLSASSGGLGLLLWDLIATTPSSSRSNQGQLPEALTANSITWPPPLLPLACSCCCHAAGAGYLR
jgi:hypothetical protein